MKLFRLPRLRRRSGAPVVPAPEYPAEAAERPGRSLEELLIPYSRRDADVPAADRGEDAPVAYATDLVEHAAFEPLADDTFAYDAFADADAEAEPEDADDDIEHDADDDHGHADVEAADDWDDDEAYWSEDLDADGAWDEPADDVHEPGDDQPAEYEPADAPALYAVPTPEAGDAHVDAPAGGWHGLEEAVRLAALDHGELLAEAGRRRIEGRRAMDRDQLIAALLSDGGADLAA